MKKATKWILPLALVIGLSACGGNKNESSESHHHDSTAHEHHDEMVSEAETSPKVVLKDDKLNAVYQHYVHLTSALINSDASEVKIASDAIETGMNMISGGSEVAKTAAKITGAATLEAQRTLYSELSNAFIPLVKKAGLSAGELYVDFCPMANGDKGGYWLSAQKEIKNPYFGDKMISCGEIKETVK